MGHPGPFSLEALMSDWRGEHPLFWRPSYQRWACRDWRCYFECTSEVVAEFLGYASASSEDRTIWYRARDKTPPLDKE